MEPGLGRNAPSDETRATQPILLDERNRETEIVGVEGSRIAARSSTDDDDVVHRFLRF